MRPARRCAPTASARSRRNDPLQRYGTAQELLDRLASTRSAGQPVARGAAGRGIANGQVFDWLLWWDNALLRALRPHLPEALLMVAVRDPRDMLLDWLASARRRRSRWSRR